MNEEILQCYDDLGNPTTEGQPKSEVKKKPYRWWYGVTKIWLVNDAGEIMCSKRSATVSGNPNKWQTTFGGHVPFGMTFEENAVKELDEEAGLSVTTDDLFPVRKDRSDEYGCFSSGFAVRFNGQPADLKFEDGETTEAKWKSMEAYEKERAANPDEWCNRCTEEDQRTILSWLKAQ